LKITDVNFLCILEVPPLGECCPGRPTPFSLHHWNSSANTDYTGYDTKCLLRTVKQTS